jgi:hypothetical protein
MPCKALVCLFALAAASVFAEMPKPAPQPGVVSHVKVLSDKVEDVSSMDAWKKSFIKDGMSNDEKGKAIWTSVVKFRHQDSVPVELLQDGGIMDAIKMFNVYGYNICYQESAHIMALARYIGMPARGWAINHHSVPEVFWDNSWHLLDASLLNYFPKADGKIAGVEEIMAGVKEWYDKNPGYFGDGKKLGAFMSNGGWRKGPEILSRCPFYNDNGWLPAKTHSWQATMWEYDGTDGGKGKPCLYDYGYSQGYEVNIQLRPGERLTRNWSNKGLHINMEGDGGPPGCINAKTGEPALAYSVNTFGDLAPGRVGNGSLEYNVPLKSGEFRSAALAVENLAGVDEDHAAPAVHVKDPNQPATLIIRMPSSYVYLSGSVALKTAVGSGGEMSVFLSDNNGLDWKEIQKYTASGNEKLDLKKFVFRRYDYRLKIVMKGAGTGLDELVITHDIQHSQRPLAALAQGSNTITFSTGPQTGTITLEGSVHPETAPKQLIATDFHPELVNVNAALLQVNGKGTVTFPVSTPGDMKALRFGCNYRARDKADAWEYQVSLDGGKTFKTLDRAAGPTNGDSKYIAFSDIPAGTHSALVRFAGTAAVTTCMFGFRIDADYVEPNGGFRPVKITYVWDEDGKEKQSVHVAKSEQDAYKIDCASKPLMKSIKLELE